jgi:hypothetical protein
MPVVRRRTAVALAVLLVVAGIGFGLYAAFGPRGAFDETKTRLGIEADAPKESRPGR